MIKSKTPFNISWGKSVIQYRASHDIILIKRHQPLYPTTKTMSNDHDILYLWNFIVGKKWEVFNKRSVQEKGL